MTNGNGAPGVARRSALRIGLGIVARLVEQCGGRSHNSAVFIDRDGALLTTHRKIN